MARSLRSSRSHVERLGPLDQILEIGLIEIPGLARMDDRHLAEFGRLDQVSEGPRVDVGDVGLLRVGQAEQIAARGEALFALAVGKETVETK